MPGLQAAVELRLGKKRAGQLEDLVGSPQFLVLPLQRLDVLAIGSAHAVSLASINIIALDPFQQR